MLVEVLYTKYVVSVLWSFQHKFVAIGARVRTQFVRHICSSSRRLRLVREGCCSLVHELKVQKAKRIASLRYSVGTCIVSRPRRSQLGRTHFTGRFRYLRTHVTRCFRYLPISYGFTAICTCGYVTELQTPNRIGAGRRELPTKHDRSTHHF